MVKLVVPGLYQHSIPLHPTIGKNTSKKKEPKKNLLRKKFLYLTYSTYHRIPVLPPMDLAHAQVQIKYKQEINLEEP
jgi:hypothetical protein